MAGRLRNRREPCAQDEQAEKCEVVGLDDASAEVAPEKKTKAKAPAAPKLKKVRAKKKGIQFPQIVQEPMPKWAPSVE